MRVAVLTQMDTRAFFLNGHSTSALYQSGCLLTHCCPPPEPCVETDPESESVSEDLCTTLTPEPSTGVLGFLFNPFLKEKLFL